MMLYARINLIQTYYQMMDSDWQHITNPDTVMLNHIYITYCKHKNFPSFMPIFESEYFDPNNDVIGYYDDSRLVAFSLIRRYSIDDAECVQFAWDYSKPKRRLGIQSLKHECALYKEKGFKYLYLGEADEYKSEIDGFEILGPLK